MWANRFGHIQRTRSGEEGYALIVTMMVCFTMLILCIGTVTSGMRLDNASARDSRWNLALQVAEAGVDHTLFELTSGDSYTGTGTTPIAVPGGEVETSVTTPKAGWRVVVSTGYVPSKTAANVVKRRIRVTYGPYPSFKFALFSSSGLEVKNNDASVGDVFANESIVMMSNSGITGSVISGTGSVYMHNNAEVHKYAGEGGNVYSGGYDADGKWGIFMSSGTVIEGSAYAEAETCPGVTEDSSRYNIANAGTIRDNAIARGSINGSVMGTATPYRCQVRHGRQTIPEYHYDASLYTAATEYTTVASFQTWVSANASNLTGVRRVWVDSCQSDPSGASSVLELGGTVLKDGFKVITNCRIDFTNNTSYSGSSDGLVEIIAINTSTSPAAIDIKNSFTIPDPPPAVLLFSTGLIDVKNSAETNGGVYGGAISIKNNLEITYDPRIERTIGFGPEKFNRVSWEEISA